MCRLPQIFRDNVITLSFPVICSTVRVFRVSLLEEMHQDYVSFARANGMSIERIL